MIYLPNKLKLMFRSEGMICEYQRHDAINSIIYKIHNYEYKIDIEAQIMNYTSTQEILEKMVQSLKQQLCAIQVYKWDAYPDWIYRVEVITQIMQIIKDYLYFYGNANANN